MIAVLDQRNITQCHLVFSFRPSDRDVSQLGQTNNKGGGFVVFVCVYARVIYFALAFDVACPSYYSNSVRARTKITKLSKVLIACIWVIGCSAR